ncbi:MAG: tRNA (adenosine(37)-N6)-threonylcarbamoyltransferase complex dimerization subunit type 1 TsaB [Desulfosalsimonadaceae bacterium]
MKILAIDTSGNTCSVALTEKETLFYEYTADPGRTHAVQLAGMIDAVLGASGLSVGDLEGFAVTTGPGSFTGLRIGIATVKGLAFAASKPVAPVSTLEVLAFQCTGVETFICPLIDARKNEVYAATYRWRGDHLDLVGRPQVTSPEQMLQGSREKCFYVGSGALLYRDLIARRLGDQAVIAPPRMGPVRASAVACLGFRQLHHGDGMTPQDVTPFYIRRSDAEKNRQG